MRVTCETSQVLLVGVPGGSWGGSPIVAPPTIWPFSYERNNLERDNLNKKKIKIVEIRFYSLILTLDRSNIGTVCTAFSKKFISSIQVVQ